MEEKLIKQDQNSPSMNDSKLEGPKDSAADRADTPVNLKDSKTGKPSAKERLSSAKDKFKAQPIETVFFVSKIIQFVNAGILILVGLLRFGLIKSYYEEPWAFSGFCLSLFVIIFGVMILVVELSAKLSMAGREWFYFLNFFWGKGAFAIFITLFLFGSGASVRWLDILTGIYFMLISILFAVLAIMKSDGE